MMQFSGRTLGSGARRARRFLAAASVAVAMLAATAGASIAHPLGNFTINHFAGIVVGVDTISLDVVIDSAEIPTVAERQRIDSNGDGSVSPTEVEAERRAACGRLMAALHLSRDGQPISLAVAAAGLTFPTGAGGLDTMRVVCEYVADLASPITADTTLHFADTSNAERIGWREIIVGGDGSTISGSLIRTATVSSRLTDYPTSLLQIPLSIREVQFVASAGGTPVPAACVADAYPVDATPTAASGGYGCGSAASAPVPNSSATSAVPGGVGGEIAGLLSGSDLSLPVVALSILIAMGLGAAHALTPGHGKTVMAAYLVGTRGTARHALALGLTVTMSHTLGVLALAGVILAFRVVSPDSYSHAAGILSGALVIGIGGWLFLGQGLPLIRQRWASRRRSASGKIPRAYPDEHVSGHEHDHALGHEHGHERDADHGHDHAAPGQHRHGGVAHSHVPATNGPISIRSLVALGLFGGLVPSINALIILLATVATGRAGYGLVLVVAFGAGMAIVLCGIGLGLVYAGRWMETRPGSGRIRAGLTWAPAITSLAILGMGLYVTVSAIAGSPTF